MAQFILLYANGPAERPPEPTQEEMERAIAEYVAWAGKLRASSQMVGGARLTSVWRDPGRVCNGVGEKFLATDGPLAETKEVIGGYHIVEAADYDEAARLCAHHPHLQRGRIFIRQLA